MNADGRTPRAWYHGWNIVMVCILAGFSANGLAINSFSLFLHEWARDFHARISDLQIGIAGIGIGCSLISPIAGFLVDRYTPRLILVAGLVALAVMCIGMSQVHSVLGYVLLYTVPGAIMLSMSTSLPANALVAGWFVRRRGMAMGFVAVGLGLAGVVMPPVIAAVMPAVGWRSIWLALGVISVVLLVPLVLLVVRERRESDGSHYMSGVATAMTGPHAHGGGKSATGVRDILSSRIFWVLVVTYIPMLATFGGGGQNLAPIAASRGMGPDVAGICLSLFSAAQVIVMLAGGILSDRVGNRLPLAGLALIAAMGGALVATAQTPLMLAIGAICIGSGGAFWPLVAAALAGRFGAGGMGRAFGLLTLFLPIVGVVPFTVAKLQETSGSYAPAFLALAGAALVSSLVCFFGLRETQAIGDPAASPQPV